MADPAHLEIAKKGAKAVARWGDSHFGDSMDLSEAELSEAKLREADLRKANLIGANLTGANLGWAILCWADLSGAHLTGADLRWVDLGWANLRWAHLTGANLRGADLRRTNLSGANLSGANLSEADLSGANLRVADLSKADLSGANLIGADLMRANLTGAILTRARCHGTTLGDCDLSECRGVEMVAHAGPSTIGIDTLLRTARAGGGSLAPAVQAFLLGAGVPRELLDMVPALLKEVRYYSCFIAYGGLDNVFAQKLYEDLKARGVSCWLFDADARVGRPVWGEIGKGRREADKVIITCSADSLLSDGLLKEIEETADEDPSKLVPISLDNIWTAEGFKVEKGLRDLKPFLDNPIYADFVGWEKNEKIYQKGLEKLLKGLQREKAAKGG